MNDHRRQALDVNDRTYAAWNAHDPDAVAAVFAVDAVVRENGGTAVTRTLGVRGVAVLAEVHRFVLFQGGICALGGTRVSHGS